MSDHHQRTSQMQLEIIALTRDDAYAERYGFLLALQMLDWDGTRRLLASIEDLVRAPQYQDRRRLSEAVRERFS